MAWNDKKDSNFFGANGPPELDEIIAKFKEKFTKISGGDGGDGRGPGSIKIANLGGSIKIIIALALLVWLAFGFYIIDTGERGVVLRFGKFQYETLAGPHWHYPYPIETVNIVKIDEIRSAKIGFRNISTNNNRQITGNVTSESLMLTKDENIIDAKFEVQYRIKDARAYLFNVANPHLTLRQISESVIRLVVGRNNMDFILTEGRSAIISDIEEGAQKLLDFYKIGLLITTVNMVDAQAPEQVQAAFSDVVKAREDKERLINEAQTYSNGILPQARGSSARMLEEARAYKSRVISKAEGETNRFDNVRREYEKAPEVTRERLYLETIENVLANTGKIIVDSRGNNVMYFPIDRLSRQFSAEQTKTNQTSSQVSPNRNINNTGGVRNIFRNREVR